MKYTKGPKSYEDLADILINRGLICEKADLISRLKSVNYYRLTGYLYYFREDGDNYKKGTSLDQVWKIYRFDRQLRFLILDAIERVEVALRSKLASKHSAKNGPFGYLDHKTLPKLGQQKHLDWLNVIKGEMGKSNEHSIQHFKSKYGDQHKEPPVWITVELMSFGRTLSFFKGVDDEIRQDIAKDYAVSDVVLESWALTLNTLRNICAHHGRLWNSSVVTWPKIPKQRKYPEWYTPYPVPRDKLFGILTILNYMLKVDAPKSGWKQRLIQLLDNHNDVDIAVMGFPKDWQSSPLWK